MGAANLRFAVESDLPEVLRMGKAFYDASGYQDMGEYSPETATPLLKTLIENKTLIVCDGGMIGWVNFPVFMTGQIVAQELFWWVDSDKRSSGSGLDLLKSAEEKAKSDGATAMIMLCLDDLEGESIAKIYDKIGYRSRERSFMRQL